MASWRKYLAHSKYTRNEEIGRGSFGIVYKVTDNETHRIFVMKRVEKSNDYAKARQEIIALTQLDHPNVVGHHESFEDEIGYCILMEFCGGGSMEGEIEQRKLGDGTPFPESQIMKWSGQIISAIVYVHDMGIIHRDIKPGNVMLSAWKEVKLGDFGGVKITADNKAETAVGTLAYMAPDVVKAAMTGVKYGPLIDEWSTGIVIFQLATLEMPFRGMARIDMVYRKLQQKAFDMPLSTIESPIVRSIVERLLVFDPGHRTPAKDLRHYFEFYKQRDGDSSQPSPVSDVRPAVRDFDSIEPSKTYQEFRTLSNNGIFGPQTSAVRDRKTGSVGVLKLRPAKLMGDREKDQLKSDIAKCASIKHRHIMSYRRLMQSSANDIAIVLEFFREGSLFKAIQRQKTHFNQAEVIKMGRQMIGAVTFIHEAGLVHKDINTDNIYLKRGTDWLKLGDFGVTLHHLGVPTLLKSHPSKVPYLAPELVSGSSGWNLPGAASQGEWTDKTDLWALGCVLHEITTLRPTFDGSGVSLVSKIKKAKYPPLPEGKYSREIEKVIADLLVKKPEQRKRAAQLLTI